MRTAAAPPHLSSIVRSYRLSSKSISSEIENSCLFLPCCCPCCFPLLLIFASVCYCCCPLLLSPLFMLPHCGCPCCCCPMRPPPRLPLLPLPLSLMLPLLLLPPCCCCPCSLLLPPAAAPAAAPSAAPAAAAAFLLQFASPSSALPWSLPSQVVFCTMYEANLLIGRRRRSARAPIVCPSIVPRNNGTARERRTAGSIRKIMN